MKTIAAIVLVCALQGAAEAQLVPGGFGPAQSSSGQFVVRASETAALPPPLAVLAANTNYILLEPAVLAVSCERIKQKLWLKLGATAPWRGRIYLNLHPARSADEWVTVVSENFGDGWRYRLEMPNLLERNRFMRALVQVLLLEMSNRGANARQAEIPAWLAEGLSRELRAGSERELLLTPPLWNGRGLAISPLLLSDARWSNPLERAQKELRAQPSLTFEELSWPGDGQLTGEAGEIYRSSAQLLVNQLLGLKDGQACLRAMLEGLPRYYNWQLAFLAAFHADFQTPLDVEKWWALQTVQFTGRDLTQAWPRDESWRKLDEIIRSQVEVRTGNDELPLHTEASLQTILREWEGAQQIPLLQRKLLELDLLRPRAAIEMAPLVDDYRRAIQIYLQKRNPTGTVSDRLVADTVNQLDALDARREALRPTTPAAATSATQPGSGAVPQ